MSPPIEIAVGGIRWWVDPSCRDHLLGPQGLRLEEWLKGGQATVVKQGPHRVVYRIELPGLSCHLKHNRLSDVRSWLRALIRPSKARTEYRQALKVAARGVPTIVPLALGEQCGRFGPRESILVTRTLDGAMMLHTFVETALETMPIDRQARLRQRLAVCLGEFIARVHEAGILHDDLHCGNILVQLEADDKPRLYLVDLQSVRLGPPLDWPASRENLVVLNRWPSLRASRTDRQRFWRAYCRAREALSGVPVPPRGVTSAWARQLEKRTHHSNLEFWRHRDRRCLSTNRYYRQVCAGALTGHAVTDLDPGALATLLADPDAPFSGPAGALIKDSRSSTVVEVEVPVGGQPRRVIYKRFRVTAWRDPLVGLLRRSPAMRSWVSGHGLRERGLPTARPLAVFHRRRAGLWHEGYLLMEKVPDAVDLRRLAADLGDPKAPPRRRIVGPLLEQLGRLVRRLHQRRLAHRDLKATNILVQTAGPRPACWLIDLVGVARRRRLPRSVRVKNLARLHASFHQDPRVTRTDKLRFLRAYLQWGLRGRQGWKAWWRAIEQATRVKAARNVRLGRPLT
jgi:tRNA A-37 threonylcarbamoyl transferase component Bud32